MKQSSSFFSSKHSALVLGLMLGASALVGSIAYAQLSIPSTIENMRITIRQIFLSEKGITAGDNAPVVLDGTNGGVIRVNQTLGQGGNITAAGTITTQNLVSNGDVIFTKLKCSEAIAAGQRFSQSQSIQSQSIQSQSIAIPIDRSIDDPIDPIEGSDTQETEEIYCVLMTDANGTVHIRTRDQFNERIGSTNGDVFKRNPSNANDSFFATANGNAAEAGKDYLRVGVTETGVITTEPDTAMLVAGTTEIRGDLALRKVNGTNLGNDPKNRNFNITNDPAGYTELTTEISNQKIEYNTQYRPNALSATTNADIVFNARNVGIGTTNPSSKLEISDNQNARLTINRQGTWATSPADIKFSTDAGNTDFWTLGMQPDSTNNFYLKKNANNYLTVLENNGNVGIGKNMTSPAAKLHINASTEGQAGPVEALRIQGPNSPGNANSAQDIKWSFAAAGSSLIRSYRGGSWDTYLQFFTNAGGEGSDNPQVRMHINENGNVGIGTNLTTPQKKLDVRGNASITENLIIGHDAAFDPGSDRLSVNGTARANAYYYNSDAKYKSDITPLTSALDKILKLNGYSYYNKLSEKNDIGVIAQEVEKVFPELVQTDAQGYKSVAYGNLVAPLIEAVKELSAKIDELFDKYVDQQAQIDALEARIQALENNK